MGKTTDKPLTGRSSASPVGGVCVPAGAAGLICECGELELVSEPDEDLDQLCCRCTLTIPENPMGRDER